MAIQDRMESKDQLDLQDLKAQTDMPERMDNSYLQDAIKLYYTDFEGLTDF